MNKTALVIPTLNAVQRGFWKEVLAAIAKQDIPDLLKIIVDSSSDDDTCSVAAQYGWIIFKIARAKFNHGGTRDRICRILKKKGVENVIFMSQDVILENPTSLSVLLKYLEDNDISGCYGKQISSHENSFNGWQRQRCYPDESNIRNFQDLAIDGAKSVFFSNAFSAWKTADIIKYGGFARTNFGEDTLLALSILKAGGRIGYCAEAVVKHEHSNAVIDLFFRGWQIGDFHRNHPELQKIICKSKRNVRISSVPISIIFPLAIKVLGYLTSRFRDIVLPLILFCLVWVLVLPAILWSDVPKPDIAARYAPMAEAFAEGNWQFAFHPRVTPLLPVAAGMIVWLCNCSGFMACKLASTLFLSASVLPLWYACKKIYGTAVAFVSGLIFASSAYLLRLGYYGVRETVSISGASMLLCAAAELYRKHISLKGWIYFIFGEVLLLVSRGDMALFALFAFIVFLVFDCIKNRWPFRCLAGGVIILLLLSPLLCYNYVMIGYPVPEVRHAVVMKKMIDRLPFFSFLKNPTPAVEIDIDMQRSGGGNE